MQMELTYFESAVKIITAALIVQNNVSDGFTLWSTDGNTQQCKHVTGRTYVLQLIACQTMDCYVL